MYYTFRPKSCPEYTGRWPPGFQHTLHDCQSGKVANRGKNKLAYFKQETVGNLFRAIHSSLKGKVKFTELITFLYANRRCFIKADI
jgi:hypothetical protein